MSSGGTSSSDARDVPNQPQQPSKSRRAQVNVACERCRRRKQKCSGTRPSCEACVARRATCIYDTEPDVTRNGALKRKYNVLEDENANLRTLVDFLAHRPISEANTILQRLRSGEEVASIISYVQNGDIAEQTHLGGVHTILGALWSVHGPSGGWLNAQLGHLFPPLTTDSTTKPRDKRMMIDHLVSTAPTVSSTTPDPAFLRNGRALFPVKVTSLRAIHPLVDRRLHRIDASTWTAVPVDSIVVINLIQIYLSWHHTYYRFFDERLFLDDLASGGYNFCSPLLVNAICAFACCLSAQLDIEALGLRKLFLQEGNRLWEASSRIDSIVVLSAGSILFATNYICTDEKTALAQLYHGRQIAFRLGMFSHDSNTVVLPSDEMSAAFLQAKAVAAWGYYNICANVSLHLPQGPILSGQPCLPTKFEYDDEITWISWPCSDKPMPTMPKSRYLLLTSLCKIINDFVSFRQKLVAMNLASLDHSDPASLRTAGILLHSLAKWAENLPSRDGAPPYILELHMLVHSIIMAAFRKFTMTNEFSAQIYEASLHQLCALICISVEEWGGPPNFINTVPMIHQTAFSLMHKYNEDSKVAGMFLTCCTLLESLIPCHPMTQYLLLLILVKASKDYGIELPSRLQTLLEQLKRRPREPSSTDDSQVLPDSTTFTYTVDFDLALNDTQAASLEALMKQVEV